MSGNPWEDFAAVPAEAGPWTDYQSEATPVTKQDIKDWAKNFIPGVAGVRALPHIAYGATQPLMAISQLASRAIPGGLFGSVPPEQVDAAQAALKQAYTERFNPDNSVGAALGQGVGSGIGPGIVAGKVLPAAATMLGRAVQGAGIGAAQGGLTPTSGQGDFATEKLGQVTSGAKWGAGASLGLDALGRVLAPKLSPDMRQLTDAGISPTIGQRAGGWVKALEEKATSIPLVGDLIKWNQAQGLDQFNRALYNRILGKIGAPAYTGEVGQKGIEHVQNAASGFYDSILSRSVPAVPAADPAFSQGMNMVARMVPLSQRPTFIDSATNLLKDHVTPTGTLTPSGLKAIDSEFGRLGRVASGSSVGSEQELGRAYQQAAQEVRQMYTRANPNLKPEMDAANAAWSDLVQMENGARGTKVARNEGVLTPADFLKGIYKSDFSVRDRKFTAGKMNNQDFAQIADRVLSSKYPDSGSAGRAMVGLLGAGGLGYMSPGGLATVGLSALPYLPGTRAAFSANRPQAVRYLGENLPNYIPALIPGITGGLLGGP